MSTYRIRMGLRTVQDDFGLVQPRKALHPAARTGRWRDLTGPGWWQPGPVDGPGMAWPPLPGRSLEAHGATADVSRRTGPPPSVLHLPPDGHCPGGSAWRHREQLR